MENTVRIPILLALIFLPQLVVAETVSLKDDAIQFDLPTDFRVLSPEEMAAKFPRGTLPSVAYGNQENSVSIAIIFSKHEQDPSKLGQLKEQMEQALPKTIANLHWVKRELVVAHGTTWVHFEFETFDPDAEFHNHFYLTSFRGRMLGFNFNSTISAYPEYQQALKKSLKSVRIHD
jgi:hypothetical protein